MRRKDIIIGFIVILLVVAGIIFVWKKSLLKKQSGVQFVTPSVEERIEDAFKLQIPDDLEKAELKDVADSGFTGLATRKYKNNQFQLTLLADLPDPEGGSFYRGWLAKGKEGQSDYQIISLGVLRLAKGGYLVDFESATDFTDYKNVFITRQNSGETRPGKRLLEGSF